MLKNLSRWLLDEPLDEPTTIVEPVRVGIPGISGRRDCVLVLDASGSMRDNDWTPSRLSGAKKAAIEFCKKLNSDNPESRVAIVAYGCRAKTLCALTPVRDVKVLIKAIKEIRDLGSTNMKEGLSEALKLLASSSGECQVIFLSDGGNTGRCPLVLAKRIRNIAIIECVGIGGSPDDVDEELLKKIASCHLDGSPRYRWIGDKEQLVQHFEQLAGRISKS